MTRCSFSLRRSEGGPTYTGTRTSWDTSGHIQFPDRHLSAQLPACGGTEKRVRVRFHPGSLRMPSREPWNMAPSCYCRSTATPSIKITTCSATPAGERMPEKESFSWRMAGSPASLGRQQDHRTRPLSDHPSRLTGLSFFPFSSPFSGLFSGPFFSLSFQHFFLLFLQNILKNLIDRIPYAVVIYIRCGKQQHTIRWHSTVGVRRIGSAEVTSSILVASSQKSLRTC